jgi:hypothetical protein
MHTPHVGLDISDSTDGEKLVVISLRETEGGEPYFVGLTASETTFLIKELSHLFAEIVPDES